MNAERAKARGFRAAGALAALALSTAGADDFRWSWEKSNTPASPPANTGNVGFSWGWRTSETVRTATPVKAATPAAPERAGAISAAGAGSVDASAYNELLRENLELRRKLTDTSAGESRLAGENQRLTTEVKSLEGQIGKLAVSLQELKQKEPSGANTREMESRLAAAEAERARLQESLTALSKAAEERQRAAASAPVAAALPSVSPVERGSDLFRRMEKENLELRESLARLEAEHKRTVEAQARIAGDEARTRETVADLSGREKALRDELAAAAIAAKERDQKNKDLMERLPRLESDLASLTRDVEAKAAALTERNRQIETLKEELQRRENRLTGVERSAAIMEQAKREVQQSTDREKRDMHYNMGAMYARDGKFRNAEQEYLAALQIDPSDADVHYNLGILYDENLGDKIKAAMHYRRFIMLKPHGPDADAVKGWLMAIEVRH